MLWLLDSSPCLSSFPQNAGVIGKFGHATPGLVCRSQDPLNLPHRRSKVLVYAETCIRNHKEVCMRRFSVSLLFLLAGAFTFAQTPSNPPDVSKDLPVPKFTVGQVLGNYRGLPSNSGCPVSFFASRQATGQIMSAGDARQAGPAQGLHLVLDHLTQPAIESIEITVYGVSSKARVLPAGPTPEDVSKTFELRRESGSNSLSDADVWMHNVGSLSRVDLISIHYADGSTWHATADMKCRAVPSGFLRIATR
jgi:hypothetical protein